MSGLGKRDSDLRIALLSFLPVLLLLPFLQKAFHVDDTLFVYAAQQIAREPLDFYGFDINWYTSPQPMHAAMQNPPLQAYFLAIPGVLFGWSEFALHSFMLLPACLSCWFTGLLARRLGAPPLLAVLGVALSPGFLVSATQVMCDVSFLALYLGTLYLWIRGLDKQDHRLLVLASALAAAAFLTKYFGLTLVPLLATYTAVRFLSKSSAARAENYSSPGSTTLVADSSVSRPAYSCYLWLLIPVAAAVLYEFYTYRMYGQGLLTDAVIYAREAHATRVSDTWFRPGTTLVFMAACFAVPPLWAALQPTVWRSLRVPVVLWCIGGVAYAMGLLFSGHLAGYSRPVYLALQWLFWLELGGILLFFLCHAMFRRRDAENALLLFWIAGTLIFACYFNHYLNARVLLPLLPALVIGVLRGISQYKARPRPYVLTVVAVAVGALSLYVAAVDQKLADAGRRAAQEVRAMEHQGHVWFAGHWGFQYYMEQFGATALNFEQLHWQDGDLLLLPRNNGATLTLPEGLMKHYEVRAYPVLEGITTLNHQIGAGFYADTMGPLPFVFGPASAELYGVVWLRPRAG